MENTSERKYLYQHISPETAKVIEYYPWGYHLRTTIRYWVETSKAKNGGQRFCSQTINPKTGKWCATKKSVYYPIVILFLDEQEHVSYIFCRHNDDEESISTFKETHLDKLDDFQKQQLKEIIAYEKVMKNVTWTVTSSPIGPVSLFSKDPEEVEKRNRLFAEQEDHKKKEQESLRQINRAIGYEMSKIEL